MARCTIPRIFGLQDWFDSKFLDLCVKHDEYYICGNPLKKFYSDFWIAWMLTKRGYWYIGVASLPYNLTGGTVFWVWRRLSPVRKKIKSLIKRK